MTTKLLLCLAFFIAVQPIAAQKKYSPEEIKRIADLGKLWGILHYLHPSLANGTITTESLIVDNAAMLAENPTKENFRKAVDDMLRQTKDPYTKFYHERGKDSALIFSKHRDSVSVHHLDNDIVYVSMPTRAIKERKLFGRKELLPGNFSAAKGIVFDFRNERSQDYTYDNEFLDSFRKNWLGALIEPKDFRHVFKAYIQHNGPSSQHYRYHSNVYASGWRTESDSPPYDINYDVPRLQAPVAFVINGYTQTRLVNLLQTLQFAGRAVVISEGDSYLYRNTRTTTYRLSDSITVEFACGYNIIGDNYLVPAVDTIVSRINNKTLFMENCSRFLQGHQASARRLVRVSLDYIPPRIVKDSSLFANTGRRLLGLFNYWNNVQYFFPSKHLIGRNWNNVLDEYVSRFINATDTFSYYKAITSLVSEIHDSHGGIGILYNREAILKKFHYSPPVSVTMIEGRPYIIAVKSDSLSGKMPVQVLDEVIKINDVPVVQYMELFRKDFSASNETAYYNTLCSYYLFSGEKGSWVNVTLKRNGKEISVKLRRTHNARLLPVDSMTNFSKKLPLMKNLSGNVGYVNMGILHDKQIDSVMKALVKMDGIVFDLRNYPNATAWDVCEYLTRKPVQTHLNNIMRVSYHSLLYESGIDLSEFQYYVVLPRKDSQYYRGKVVVLCNEYSQSQSEYSVMMLQKASNGKVIGSQTMGADGNVSEILFPGGYVTYISALGVYYPNGTETQRVGVKIDIEVKPTVNGIKAGRDEVLERAIRYIKTGK